MYYVEASPDGEWSRVSGNFVRYGQAAHFASSMRRDAPAVNFRIRPVNYGADHVRRDQDSQVELSGKSA